MILVGGEGINITNTMVCMFTVISLTFRRPHAVLEHCYILYTTIIAARARRLNLISLAIFLFYLYIFMFILVRLYAFKMLKSLLHFIKWWEPGGNPRQSAINTSLKIQNTSLVL